MITIHKLVPPENRTLFVENPELNDIWEAPAHQQEARESYEEWDTRIYPNESTGEVFSIKKDDSTIGIIGWFEYGDIPDVLRLRYYGIVPSERGNGYGEIAMKLFLNHVSCVAPAKYIWLSESVSVNRPAYGQIKSHFKKLGFTEFDDPDYGSNAGFGAVQSLRIRIHGR